jgi:hypothetical protein
MTDLLGTAIREQKRRFILEATNNAYRTLRKDKKAWKNYLAETQTWDVATVADANLEH